LGHRVGVSYSRLSPTHCVCCGGVGSVSLMFSYEVEWHSSEVRWASRWDTYLAMSDVQIHWFSIINSVVVVFFLAGYSLELISRVRNEQKSPTRWVLSASVTVLVCNQPPRSTQPGHPSVGRHNEYQWKLGGKGRGGTSPISVVWQCKLVSGWGLKKRRSAPPYGCLMAGRTSLLHFVLPSNKNYVALTNIGGLFFDGVISVKYLAPTIFF